MIVDEGKREYLPFLIRVSRIGEIGAVHRVPLPEVAEVRPFKAPVGLGALRGEELRRGGVAPGQMTPQRARREGLLGDGIGMIEQERPDDRAGGALRLFTFERLRAVERFL